MIIKKLKFGIILGALLCTGCGSSWEYRKVGAREVAVLSHPEKVFPSYGQDLSLVIKANIPSKEVVNTSGEMQYFGTMRELYEKMDQVNAQYRNFLVASYAVYINAELEADKDTLQKARTAWLRAIEESHAHLVSYRALSMNHFATVLDTAKDLDSNVGKLAALGFDDPASMEVVAKIEVQVKHLQRMERDLPEEQRSDITVLSRAILEYRNKNYEYVIANLSHLKSPHPLKNYVLAAAYWKKKQYNEAIQASKKFESLANSMGDNRLQAMALMQKAVLKITSDDLPPREVEVEEVIGLYNEALKEDAEFWPALFNRANAYSRKKDMVESLKDLNEFVKKSNMPIEWVLKSVEKDSDPKDAFYNLLSHLKEEGGKQHKDWKDILKSRLK